MSASNVIEAPISDVTLQKLAIEIARDLFPLHTILENHAIPLSRWDEIQHNRAFKQYLATAVEEWNGAMSTHERVRVKSAVMIEQWLEEAHARLHDKSENLNAKTELAKLVSRLAGMGSEKAMVQDVGEKFSVTINLGSDKQLKIEKQVTPRVLDGEVIEHD